MMAQPVILATQEAEIQRVTIQKPAQANTLWHPISKNPSQKALVEWLKWYSAA
jgi:hypothetical protein